MKRYILIISFIVLVFCGSGCTEQNVIPINAVFKNLTLPTSNNYTISVVFTKDKRFEDKFYDICIKTDTKNTKLNFRRELVNEENYLTLENAGTWYSLNNLIPNMEFEKLVVPTSQTYIFSSDSEVKLTFKVIAGEKKENYKYLVNTVNVSKEFDVKIENILKNT